MTREDVIREIVERELRNQGLSVEVVLREAPNLHIDACDHFGTWDTALRYAGISRRRLGAEGGYSRERVLQKIGRLCQDGYSLRAGHNQRRDPELYDAARRHFGGWKRALRAAGIDLKKAGLRTQPRRLDKQAIITALRQRQREGRSLRRCDVSREDRTLATAAKHAFLSWWRALEAAALAPDVPQDRGRLQRWSKQLVIEAIQRRQQDGKPVSVTSARNDDAPLEAAARRHFGSWAEAIRASGIALEKNLGGGPAK